eukprot:TRINITY_DN7136_c0_g1_i1.p1 TRINITY_DN7136_c0_g1~~TRINITY_DN7136_c0_g1_i1.p1  ORF type:complete len:477 (+),score=109.76 TRINITY_DN7136_c0_g1_i1:281-1711(+)
MGLKNWVDKYVKNTFIPHIKSEYKKRISNATELIDSFKSRDKTKRAYRKDEELRPLLNSVVEMNKCLNELYKDIQAIPDPIYVTEFHQIISEILNKFLNTCKQKVQYALEKTETWELMKNEKFRLFVMTDPRYRKIIYDAKNSPRKTSTAVRTNIFQPTSFEEGKSRKTAQSMAIDDVEEQAKYDEMEFQNETAAYEGKRISDPAQDLNVEHLQKDQNLLGLLANIHDSLYWLVTNIYRLGRSKENKDEKDEKKEDDWRMKLQTTKLPNINVDIHRFAEEFRRLADLCLLSLRSEIRLFIFCYLDFMRAVPYVYDTDYDKEPDTFVSDITKYLAQTQETLTCCLPREKVMYLFAGLPDLITRIFMNSLSKLKGINKHGIAKIKRNTFALQQTFTNMNIPISEENFDRVRKYYALLDGKVKDLINQLAHQIAERANIFSLEEFTKIIAFLSPNKKVHPQTLKILTGLYVGDTSIKLT